MRARSTWLRAGEQTPGHIQSGRFSARANPNGEGPKAGGKTKSVATDTLHGRTKPAGGREERNEPETSAVLLLPSGILKRGNYRREKQQRQENHDDHAFANRGGSRTKTELGGKLDACLLVRRTSDLLTEDKNREDPWAVVSINRDKHAKICRKENSSREMTDRVLHELEIMAVKVITEQDYKSKQQK
jgi:hypothetical protein